MPVLHVCRTAACIQVCMHTQHGVCCTINYNLWTISGTAGPRIRMTPSVTLHAQCMHVFGVSHAMLVFQPTLRGALSKRPVLQWLRRVTEGVIQIRGPAVPEIVHRDAQHDPGECRWLQWRGDSSRCPAAGAAGAVWESWGPPPRLLGSEGTRAKGLVRRRGDATLLSHSVATQQSQ